jgi:hypothetical protein
MIDPETDEIFENDVDFDSFEKPASLAMEDYENGEIEFDYEKEEPFIEEEAETEE